LSNLPTQQHLKKAVRILNQDGVIAYPTEAVYGLGCNPLNPEAVYRLLALKQRDPAKGLILIAANFKQLKPFLLPIKKKLKKQLSKTWPGPVTWLLPARPECPTWLTGKHNTLAVRVTAHPGCRALCQALQSPLISSSANISQRRPTNRKLIVLKQFGRDIDYILPGETGNLEKPTEIRSQQGCVIRSG
jgi:L-threonylcarbamoyladenylate synthase